MEFKTRILIASENGDLASKVQSIINNEEIEVIKVENDGIVLIEKIATDNADIVIMDSHMPHIDAVGVMSTSAYKANIKEPAYFVIENEAEKMMAKELYDAGASYCFAKPIDLDLLQNKIRQVRRRQEYISKNETYENSQVISEDDLKLKVTGILHQIGIPAHIKGYHYVRRAIILAVQDSDMINAVTKLLYPTVAKEYETTPSRVERAIRHAIEVAWDRGDVEVLTSYFGYTINSGRGKPTNSEFIAMIADKLRLEQRRAG